MVPGRHLLDRLLVAAGRTPLGQLLDHLGRVHGDRRLVEQPTPVTLAAGDEDGRSLTYAEAAALVARASDVLAPRCHGGRRVVVRGDNDYGFFLTCLAVSRAGGIVIPVNPRMREDEIAHVVADAEAEVVDVSALSAALAAGDGDAGSAAQPPSSDVAGIFYTSGTTGRPKGARLKHAALVEPAGWTALWPAGLRRDELVASLPIAHIMGFEVLIAAAGSGVPVYFLPRFSPTAVLDAIEARRATVFVGVPAMYRMMLDAGAEERDLRSIRLWISAADVMPPDLARRFKRMGATITLPLVGASLGEAVFAQGYGMVELGGAATAKISPPGTSLGLGDVLGVGLLGRHLRVVDEQGDDVPPGEIGELLVKSSRSTLGYHGDPERTRELVTPDGWVRTGDLGVRGPLGVVRFAGRKKDVLMRGGYSVYPAEIEETLRSHPAVAEAAVVGVADEVTGEVPVAYVRLEPGAEAEPEDLLAFAREQLADYKAPVEIEIVEEFPRTGTGKVAKHRLREA